MSQINFKKFLRKKFLIGYASLSIVFLQTIYCHSQSTWFWLNPLPTGNNINSIKFINSTSGIAVGNNGCILKTTNAGINWFVINNNSIEKLNSVAYKDENNVYICGNNGLVISSTNGGDTWKKIELSEINNFNTLYFKNSLIGYLLSDSGIIYKTFDGGSTWEIQNLGIPRTLKSIFYVNEDTVMICGQGILFKSFDDGKTWSNRAFAGILNSVKFINNSTGFVAGENGTEGMIIRTTNGGETWPFYTGSSGGLYDMQFINSSIGYSCGTNRYMLKTTNGGLNWSNTSEITSYGYSLNSLQIMPSGTGYLAGTFGIIFKSLDFGITWNIINPTGNLGDGSYLSFINTNTGYYIDITAKTMFKTTNGGVNWQNLFMNISAQYFTSLEFLNENFGFMTAFPLLYKTNNGGLNWSRIYTPNDTASVTSQFINENTGFTTTIPFAYTNTYYKTTNGGSEWNQKIFSHGYVGVFRFLEPDYGLMQGFNPSDASFNVYLSTDTGESWSFLNKIDVGETLQNPLIKFVNPDLYFLSTGHFQNRRMYRSTNGGKNWSFSCNTYDNAFTNIYFKDSNTGFRLHGQNFIFITTNQGLTWDSVEFSDQSVYSMAFPNSITGYASGSQGMIKKTTTGGVSFIDEDPNVFVSNDFILHNNYPNPFNPETVIRYTLKLPGVVTLKVFDIQGKEVSNLINKMQSAGVHTAIFNGKNLPSGIYFCSLQINHQSRTIKMLLVK